MSSEASNPAEKPSRPTNPPPADPVKDDPDILEEDDDEAIRRAEEKAEAEAARKAAEEAQRQREVAAQELEERRRVMAEAAAAHSWRKAKAQPVGVDPDDGGDGDDDEDDEGERAPCEQCRSKKIPCQMQAGKRSSIICKPCHDAKVKCSYSGRPSTVKREGGGQPIGERLAILESQMAQLLADNRQLREGQLKDNNYNCHLQPQVGLVDDGRRKEEEFAAGDAGTRTIAAAEEEKKGCG
ncbi:MAG: hypothetical protein NXY57DRAFT_969498 [Lentinula lateritia]|nr:MAG: hypothetical protein NXY57DRAFT_969498 [Lentinula lateritia]